METNYFSFFPFPNTFIYLKTFHIPLTSNRLYLIIFPVSILILIGLFILNKGTKDGTNDYAASVPSFIYKTTSLNDSSEVYASSYTVICLTII